MAEKSKIGGLEKPLKSTKSTRLTAIKIYLLAYNVTSCLLWAHLLYLTVSSTFYSSPPPTTATSSFLSRLISSAPFPPQKRFAPKSVTDFFNTCINHLRGGYDYNSLGWWTKYTQSLATLEIIHSALGWVRSPLPTVFSQVFSRLWAVWAIVEPVPSTHNNPLFTTMLFAWSVTEVIRYAFYALSILGIDLYALNWLRYNTFLPLYPLGASSEAFLAFSTLPPISNLPYVPSFLSSLSPISWFLTHMPSSIRDFVIRSYLGRGLLWRMAQAGVKAKSAVMVKTPWTLIDFVRLFFFFVWWPALYILYSHMLVQRRKFFRQSKTIGVKNKVL